MKEKLACALFQHCNYQRIYHLTSHRAIRWLHFTQLASAGTFTLGSTNIPHKESIKQYLMASLKLQQEK